MNTLTIKDLPKTETLDSKTMLAFRGGMGRTPPQILAWELTNQPATWQGLVLGADGRLYPPAL
jgi:hypothetical protein